MREKRVHQRTNYAVPVEVHLPSGETLPAHSRDLSLGGLFLETDKVIGIGTELSIELELPQLGLCRLPGYVRWTRTDGFGIQFGLMGARETHAIGKLLRAAATDSRVTS